MSRIALAMIVRDAGTTLRACLESLRPHVDFVAIADTGSTDGSPAIAQEFADRWELYTGCNRNPLTGAIDATIWDFSDARNFSFSLVPPDIETILWIDADDVVIGAEHLRSLAASLPESNSAALIPYEYSYDAAGNCTCVHWRERLLRPASAFVWTTPCHEVCMPRAGGVQAVTVPNDADGRPLVMIKHRAQWAASQPGSKPREPQRNLRILRAYLQRVGESDPRAMYYCGVEYARAGAFGAAQDMLARYAEISGWADEKCLAELELGRIALSSGGYNQAIKWAQAATLTKAWPDPYFLMAKAFFGMAVEGSQAERDRNLHRAKKFYEDGARLPDAETVLFYNPTERFDIERYVAQIHAHFGDIDGAAEACRRGLKGLNGDPDLMDQLRQYEAVRIGREVDTSLARLVTLGKISAQVAEACEALISGKVQLEAPQAAPVPANDTRPALPPVDESTLPPVEDGKLDVVIFTGPAYENWTPKTIEETGIGGSETMAWEMARGLAACGHRVRHYGHCTPEQEGVYDGVHWFDAARYTQVSCDVLVVSRYAAFVDQPGVEARVRLLWVHDVVPAALYPHNWQRFDRILCLSNWHKQYVLETHPFVDPGRVVVTRNGIDFELFEQDVERNNNKCIYSSSPDRGLQTLLDLWPDIRAQVPDAELVVTYGFDNLRKGHPGNRELADKLEAKARELPGVKLLGRLGPKELAREFLSSGCWAMPEWFSETYSITAAQAQAAGCRIVATPIAALNETVGERGVLIPGGPQPIDINVSYECAPASEEFRAAFVAAVVEAMAYYPKRPSETRGYQARQALDRFDIRTLCADWSAMLTSLVSEVTEQVVPPFYCHPAFVEAARAADGEVEAA